MDFTKPKGWKISPEDYLARRTAREQLSPEQRAKVDRRLIASSSARNAPDVFYSLEKGANPDASNMGGYTALMCAAQNGHTNTVRTLLQGWANPGLWWKSQCAFIMAVSHRRINTAELIREYLPPVLPAQIRESMEEVCKSAPQPVRAYMYGWLKREPAAAPV